MGIQAKSGDRFAAIESSGGTHEEGEMTASSNEATIDVNQLFRLDEFEALAMTRMTVAARDLCQEGAGTGSAVRANAAAWKQWALRARVLRDVSRRDLSPSVLGTRVSLPLLIAPSGLHGLVHS